MKGHFFSLLFFSLFFNISSKNLKMRLFQCSYKLLKSLNTLVTKSKTVRVVTDTGKKNGPWYKMLTLWPHSNSNLREVWVDLGLWLCLSTWTPLCWWLTAPTGIVAKFMVGFTKVILHSSICMRDGSHTGEDAQERPHETKPNKEETSKLQTLWGPLLPCSPPWYVLPSWGWGWTRLPQVQTCDS